MPSLNREFGAFILTERIGAGAMATVYRGIQKALDRPVVVKVLFPHWAEDENLLLRFQQEGRAAARLRHSNIVQVIDSGCFEEAHFIAMEYVVGRDLEHLLGEVGAPPLEIALLMALDLCSGLEHAHEHGLVHRDIKPANLMLSNDGTLKIMDFGLARRTDEVSVTKTVVGTVVGTPAYMSPEQASGSPDVDARADIFSAGVVAYELLGGRKAFQGATFSRVMDEVLHVDPPSLGILNPLIPWEVVSLVDKMLQKDPARRCPTMTVAREDLEAMVDRMSLHRGRSLLREYAADPAAVAAALRRNRFERHRVEGARLAAAGPEKIEEAMMELRRALFLDPSNEDIVSELNALEARKREGEASPPREVVSASPTDAAATPDLEKTEVWSAPPPDALVRPKPPVRGDRQRSRPAPPRSSTPPVRTRRAGEDTGETPRPPVVRVRPAGQERPSSRRWALAAAAAVVVVLGVAAVVVKALERPGTGSVHVTSTPPGAALFVDGASYGRTNRSVPNLVEGEHTIRLELPGYEPAEQRVVVKKKAEAPVELLMTRLAEPGFDPQPPPVVDTQTVDPGTAVTPPAPTPAPNPAPQVTPEPAKPKLARLELSAQPYATFYLNGKLIAERTEVVDRELPPGKYDVRFVHPWFEPRDVRVKVEAGKPNVWNEVFPVHERGSLLVTSNKPGEVYLDGVRVGVAGQAIDGLKPGSPSMEVLGDGWGMDPRHVDITAGKRTELKVKLKKRP